MELPPQTVLELLARANRGDVIGDAVLSGTAIAVRDHGGVVFFDLHDGTALIQVVLSAETVTDVHVGDRLAVSGRIDKTSKGVLSVFPSERPRTLLAPRIAKRNHLARTFEQIGETIVLARIQGVVRDSLSSEGFVELVPRMISSTPWDPGAMTPLKVIYPGFGSPAFLAISPLPQLLRTVLQTGRPKVFAASRCFTLSHRGERAGNESAIVMSCAFGEDILRQQKATGSVLTSLMSGDVSTNETRALISKGWTSGEFGNLADAGQTVTSAALQVIVNPMQSDQQDPVGRYVSQSKVRSLRRFVLPPGIVLAEDAVLEIGEVKVGSACFYLDHYVASLGWENVRRLGALDR